MPLLVRSRTRTVDYRGGTFLVVDGRLYRDLDPNSRVFVDEDEINVNGLRIEISTEYAPANFVVDGISSSIMYRIVRRHHNVFGWDSDKGRHNSNKP